LLDLIGSHNQANPFAEDGVEAKHEEAGDEAGETQAEEETGCFFGVVFYDPERSKLHRGHDKHTKKRPKHLLPKHSMHPKQRPDIIKAISLSKDHPDDHKKNRSLLKSAIQPKTVARLLLKLFITQVLVVVSIDDPVLRHGPGLGKTKVEHDHQGEAKEREEEQVEFLRTTLSQDEARPLTVVLQLTVEGESSDEEDEASDEAEHHLEDVVLSE
jgi:hypothetical protein